jgi:hypothetical protein
MHDEIDSTNQFPNLRFFHPCSIINCDFSDPCKREREREGERKNCELRVPNESICEEHKRERQTKEANQLKMFASQTYMHKTLCKDCSLSAK